MEFEDLLDEGQKALQRDDSRSALDLLKQAITLQQTAHAWLLLAEAQLDENQTTQAKKSVTEGLKVEADNIDLLYLSADICLAEERLKPAIEVYRKIIELDQQQIDARVNIALLEMDAEKLDLAEKTCREALQVDPASVFALNALGDICTAAGKSSEALDCYLKAADLDPEEPQTFLNLADLYYDAGELEKAEKACGKALQLDAGLPLGYLTLGYIYMDQDKTKESIENFQQFLKLEKDSSAKQVCDEVKAVVEGLK